MSFEASWEDYYVEDHAPRFLFFQTSVLHMCSLFHAFIFAQLWTVYCEQSAVATNVQSQNEFSFTAILTALEFWSRVTPSILQLMAHNKVVSPKKKFLLVWGGTLESSPVIVLK